MMTIARVSAEERKWKVGGDWEVVSLEGLSKLVALVERAGVWKRKRWTQSWRGEGRKGEGRG